MAALTEELARICRELPEEKAKELVNFARFLRQQATAEKPESPEEGDEAWEQILNDSRPRPKLQAYAEKVLKEERFEPLDESRL